MRIMVDGDGANFEKNVDSSTEAGQGEAASAGFLVHSSSQTIVDGSEKPAVAAQDSGHTDTFERLPLLAYSRIEESSSANPDRQPAKGLIVKGIAMAASLLLLTAIGAAFAYDHFENTRAWDAEAARDSALAKNFTNLASRIDSIEAARGHEELGELRKIINEVRSSASTSRDVNGALAQLAARVDHVEKDQGARLDKLGDRIDHDAALRLSDMASRLDRLEKKAATVSLAVPPPVLPTTPRLLTMPKPEIAKMEPNVSNEITSSIEKAKPRLRNYFIDEIRSDYALIEGPGGAQSVTQGDYIPGAGRVVRFERRGHDWVVVTSQGVIINGPDGY